MVIVFVLLVFVLAQGFLSATLTSRTNALDDVRRELAEQMGGPEKVERHHSQGKLTVRERIDAARVARGWAGILDA